MLKYAQKIGLILVVLSTILCFFACSGNAADKNDTDTGQYTVADIEITAEYKIIYEPAASKGANTLRKKIYSLCNVTPEATSDSSAAASPYEILIGDTGRSESTEYINTFEDYGYGVSIKADANGVKILIAGKTSTYTADAVQLFLNEYMPTDSTNAKLLKTEDTVMINTEDKNKDEIIAAQPIEWLDSNIFVQKGGYARMSELKDGSIACVYSSGGYIRFCTSKDEGQSWSEPTNVIKLDKTPTGQSMAIANANIAVMKNGDYMVAFRAHTSGSSFTTFYSSIRYCISSDGGKTWSSDKIVAENTHQGTEFTGFWEPHMLYIKDGKFAMYYASDCIGGDAENYPFVKSMTYQHIIVHIYDEATGTFGEPIVASNGENHNSRDGMPVVCQLSDKTYAMVIESSSMRGRYPFIIQMLFSEDGIIWSEPKTVFTPSAVDNYSGAPYIVCLDDGRIAISFQATEGSGSNIANSSVFNSAMNVIVSEKPVTYKDKDSIEKNDFDKIFFNPIITSASNPFSIWPSMLVHNGKLLCTAECGVNTSATTRTTNGIYLRIGKVK